MNKILVTGASGYVGARIYADLQENYEVVGTYFKDKRNKKLVQIDTTEFKSVQSVFNEHKPNYIVQNAAFPVAPKNDDQQKLVEELNYKGVDNVVKVANEIGAKIIFISSAAALSSDNQYAKSKAYGEKKCKEVTAGSFIVRPHTVFGYSPNMTSDRSFNRLLRNIFLKTPAVYDTSWKFEPTYIGHIPMVIAEYLEGRIKTGLMNVAFNVLKSKYDIGLDILSPFEIKVTPKDGHSTWGILKIDVSDFSKLNLPVKNYQEMVEVMVKEIKDIGDSYPMFIYKANL